VLELKQVQAELLTFLRERRDLAGVTDAETNLIESGILDSLLVLDVALHLQTTFGVHLEASDVSLANFRTVTTLALLVVHKASRLAERAA
jgi:acyl carrier protein